MNKHSFKTTLEIAFIDTYSDNSIDDNPFSSSGMYLHYHCPPT